MDAESIQRIWSISDKLAALRPIVAAGKSLGPQPAKSAIASHIVEQGRKRGLEDAENVLLKHDAVKKAVVLFGCDPGDVLDEEKGPEAYITIREPDLAPGRQKKPSPPLEKRENQDEEQRVELWGEYWNTLTYSAMEDLKPNAIGRDFLGWTSMYDGKEIDKTEMNEWLDETISTILDIPVGTTRHVLEIGTGSGMILFNLIGKVQSYVGVEMSPTAVGFVNKMVSSRPDLTDRVHMYQGTAADLGALQMPTAPNIVVINSVAQYFPTQTYLLDLIETLVLHIPSVTAVFFGDVRSHALYDEFLLNKAVHDLGDEASRAEIRTAVATLAQRELELLIDPAFFTVLPDQFPGRIEHVQILPKRMRAANELSRYRYGAVLYLRSRPGATPAPSLHIRELDGHDGFIDFRDQGLDRGELLQRLQACTSDTLAVSNIPNSKTCVESRLVDLVLREHDSEADGRNRHGRDWLSSARSEAGRRPALSTIDLVEIAQQAGYKVEMSAARQYTQRGGFDAVFYKHVDNIKGDADGDRVYLFKFSKDHAGREMETLSTHPMKLQARRAVVEQLHKTLRAELPVHLLPRQIRVLDKIPLLENGEVDRAAMQKARI
ncbi:hypothetical protein F4802DRAFT_96039 [Xylaria palmicola]|nr:hypothetical protein F4802DRAFT_96039 [Xylaria palmicola]